MAQPVVQNLNDIISQIQAAYKPQQDIIDQSINQNEQGGQAQVAGLDAKKTQAFKTIDQNANNRGMYFSGFRPNEQATYTGSTYLPALANLQSTIATARNTLLGKKADLTVQGNNQALTLQNSQKAALQAWQDEQDQRAFQAQQADLAYQRTAAENEKSRQASARSSSGGGVSVSAAKYADEQNQANAQKQAVTALGGALSKVTGGDGYVSPNDYNAAKREWASAGYDSGSFDRYFAGFRNPGNPYYGIK
jgi:hypothetical protein